jgi:23S rRNA (uracil1939-C5)-methyltransferase
MAGGRAATAEVAQVIDLAHDGRGVAKVDGKTVFVDDALPGELVEFVRRRRQRRFDEARLARVLSMSPDRVVPPCPHFGVCGGCVLQHLAAPRQIELKQSILRDNLERIGRVEPGVLLPPLVSPATGYRRRARLGVRWVERKGRALVGFRERGSNLLADISRCLVLAPPLDDLIEPLSVLITGLTVRARLPQIEAAVGDNGTALVFRVLDPLTDADIDALRAFARHRGVRIYLQSGGYDSVAPLDPVAEPLEYALPSSGLRLAFEPTDFLQVNGPLNERMVALAVDLLAPQSHETVLDLFCGLGNFSLPLAQRAAQVIGVEGDPALVGRAAANAVANGLGNARFIVANLFEDPAEAAWSHTAAARVLLDPPRAGAREVLPALARMRPVRVVYISCHPGSLARDAGVLVHEHGYRLTHAGVMDMFPNTAHVESIAVFEAP